METFLLGKTGEAGADVTAPAGNRILRVVQWALVLLAATGAISAMGAVGGCVPDTTPRPGTRAADQPKVLLITIDTLRPDYLSGLGYPLPSSPALDSLMATSTVFTRAVTPIPRTTQALASLMTGCYPKTTGVRTLFQPLRPELVTLAQIAQRSGMSTVAVVSNHVLVPRRRLDRGFDVYDWAADTRDAESTTDAAIAHLSALDAASAVLAWVHYIDPHVPYYPPVEWARAFDPGYDGRYRDHFGQEPGGIDALAYPADLPKEIAVYRNPLPAQVNAHIRRLYAADIRATDEAIRRLLDWAHRQWNGEAVIVVTSDHGESLGEQDYYFDHGDYVNEASVRVPLLFHFPKADPRHGRRDVDDLVSLIDVMPTLLDVMGLPYPAPPAPTLEGRSLVPAIDGYALPARAVFAESGKSFFPASVRRRQSFDVAGRFRSVTLDFWKLVWTPGLPDSTAFELFDLAEDPWEMMDLAGTHRAEIHRLAPLLAAWADTGNTDAPQPPRDEIERLRSLGYIR